MSPCPSADHLLAFAAGSLTAEQAEGVEAHLDGCAECLADLARSVTAAPGGAAPGPAPDAATGATQDRFRLLRCLGEGGMGVVYEAIDQGAPGAPGEGGARVAVKTLRELSPGAGAGLTPVPLLTPQQGERLLRFKHEFRALRDVAHRNLVRLGDLVEQGGTWLFSMELVPGVALGRYLEAHPERLVPSLRQLADGLVALHGAGFVHRDIKPSNVLVQTEGDEAGRVVILDFGLIAAREGRHDLTGSRVVGTAAYMAPEQAAAEGGAPAADWYSVGVILYEVLCGRLPFEGTALQVLAEKLGAEAPPPPELDRQGRPTSHGVSSAVLRATILP